MNNNHLELFYWFLAILSLLNVANYVFWAKWYRYKKDVPIDEVKLLNASQVSGVNPSFSASVNLTPKNQDVSTNEEQEEKQNGVR